MNMPAAHEANDRAVLVNVANVEVLPIANTQYPIGIGNIGAGYWQHWQQLPPPEPEIVAHLFKLYADKVNG